MNSRKLYGRTNVNKLDWYLAIVCAICALGAIWFSIGLCINAAGSATIPAFENVLHGMAFMWSSKYHSVALSVINSVLFYGGIIFLVLGIVYLVKKEKKERIPGVVGAFIAIIGFMIFLSLVYECTGGESKGLVDAFWPYSSIVFVVALFVFIVLGILATFTKYNIELCHEAEEPKHEPIPEPKQETVVKVVKVVEVKKEVVEEEPEEGDKFDEFGDRRVRVPFEIKIRKAPKEVRGHYEEITKFLSQYAAHSRFSIGGETYSYKKEKLVFISLAGKTLKVYFALKMKDFKDSTIPVKDASEYKKFEQTPVYLKVKSDLAVKRAKQLILSVLSEHKVPKVFKK